jgi:hypothetical protein
VKKLPMVNAQLSFVIPLAIPSHLLRDTPPVQAQLSKIAFGRWKIGGVMEVSQASIGPPGQEGGPSETQAMPRSLL